MATLIGFAFVDLGTADQVASVGGGAVGLIGFALAVIAQFGGASASPTTPSNPSASARDVHASGERTIAAGGNIGVASTGGAASPGSPLPPRAPASGAPATGSVTASGTGSIAAGGDIGSASTGN
ncbi:hypothetical protein EV284_5159 [Streptomyces sp. BK022]|uniref:hypothetical protein n=1 Tax=Streptomyces sp. BK022 TaxID=2512123 RepID=UPI0010D0F814|nr:hypothetical protein [Streptomyces sp. BK022]RZU30202.1 hypothetical protein EV284_5159 [Streptomyces sp. BK022]